MATWYFGQGGNNANSGLSFALRKATYANFQASLSSGDTVYMCATTAGSSNEWECTEQINIVSGVTYKVYEGRYVLLDPVTTNPGGTIAGENGAFHGVNKTDFVINPDQGFLTISDDSSWDPVDEYGQQFAGRRSLDFRGCSNFSLIGTGTGNLTTTNSNFVVHGGKAWVANFWDANCHHYTVSGLDFSKHGTNNTGSLAENPDIDIGDLCVFGGYNCVIEYCTFRYGGHINARFSGRYQVAQFNWFDGDWDGITPNDASGRDAPLKRSGQRCCGSYAGADTDEGETASPWGPVMYHGNIFNKAGCAADQHDNCASEINSNHMIIRGNYIWDGVNDVFRSSTFDDLHNITQLKIYNNTSYGCGATITLRHVTVIDVPQYIQCDVLNNIFDKQRGAFFGSDSIRQFWRSGQGETASGYSNPWKGARIAGNVFTMHADAPTYPETTVTLRSFAGADTHYASITAIETAYPSNWYNNFEISPTYDGDPDNGDRTIAAFGPNGGVETGSAEQHATANGAGVSSQVLIVDSGQAYMFSDGWEIVEGDYIQIDDGEPVQITSINYSSNQILLAEPRSWADNAWVFLCTTEDNGANFTVWSDIGAGQGQEITPDPFEPVTSTLVMAFR